MEINEGIEQIRKNINPKLKITNNEIRRMIESEATYEYNRLLKDKYRGLGYDDCAKAAIGRIISWIGTEETHYVSTENLSEIRSLVADYRTPAVWAILLGIESRKMEG